MRFLFPFLAFIFYTFSGVAQTNPGLIPNDISKASQNKSVLLSLLSKKKIILPAGKFYVDGNIELPSHTALSGTDGKTELLMSGGAESKNFFLVNAVKEDISLSGLILNANIKSNSGEKVMVLAIGDRVSRLSFTNCSFSGSRTYGCVQIKGTEKGFCDSITFLNCRFGEAGSAALELRGVRHVEISHCYFTNWASLYKDAPAIQLQSQKCYNINIHDNQFENTHGVQFAIESAGTTGFGNVNKAIISHNRFADPRHLGGNGISGYFTNSQFTYNHHTGGNGNQRSGYEIFGGDNVISNNEIEAGLIAVSAGTVTGVNTCHVRVENNKITTKGKNSSGVLIGAWTGLRTSDVTIVKNTIDTRAATGNSSPITVGFYGKPGVVDSIQILNNTLYTNSESKPVRIQAADNSGIIILSGNVCSGELVNDVTHNTKIIRK